MVKAESLVSAERTLPHNLEAEKQVLGAMIRDTDALHRVHEVLHESAFYQPGHQTIYQVLLELSAKNFAIDLTTLSAALEQRGELNAIGGPYYLFELVDSVASSANAEFYAAIVRERAMRRMLIRQCSTIINEAYDSVDESEEIISRAEASIFQLSQKRAGRSFDRVGKYLDIAIEKIQLAHEKQGAMTGLASGYRDLDQMTAGFQSSDLIILAARPSVGKTSLVLNIAENVSLTGITAGIFSLEMSSEQIAERVLCSQAKVNLKHLRSGFVTKRDAALLFQTADRIHDIPLYVDDTPNLTPTEILSRSRRLKSEHPDLGLLIIDYLQLMSTGSKRVESRQQEVAEISRSLKILARDLHIPIIACSQLSRAVEKRDDHVPRLSDLRESGAIEQDADLVIFLHREPLKGSFEGEEEEELDAGRQIHYAYKLIIGKHRNGPVGEVDIYFAREYTRFFDAAVPTSDDDAPF
ncbi:MAG: replicative DNA helicase [Candidatus Omnitrophota bacterium]|jgi:replicative DNA helicase|nr:MAG: replicative DNA helicase [Candidatus Omnitrophota bacterium]